MSGSNKRVLVADSLDLPELAVLEESGITVLDHVGISKEDLPRALVGCHGLLVRSRTKVTAELLAAAPSLAVVGRAGTGVDNVDLSAATRAGVLVMNVPGGNTNAAAEHTIALMFALARDIPRAAQSLLAGEWSQKGFLGVELKGKTLGVIGLGRIGQRVAQAARGVGMKVVGFDPVLPEDVASDLGIAMHDLDAVCAAADFLSVHVPLVEGTRHLIDSQRIARMKRGVRILNVARGGIVDEAALLLGLESGQVGGAALDVFETEPPGASDLIRHRRVIATPHLGASTLEAQRGVARQIAEQVAAFLTEGVVRGAVNAVGWDPSEMEALSPWLDLARRLGATAQGLADGGIRHVEITAMGELSRHRREPLTNEVLAGLLQPFLGERITPINARVLASEHGIDVTERGREHHRSFHGLLRVGVESGKGRFAVGGTLFGRDQLRIVRAFGLNMDAIPEGWMLFCSHDDRPGLIGHLGTALARAGINIANMSVGRDGSGQAMAVLNLDDAPSAEVLKEIGAAPAIRWTRVVKLPGRP